AKASATSAAEENFVISASPVGCFAWYALLAVMSCLVFLAKYSPSAVLLPELL
ncbi:hypothetical protein U1Q18_014860, partial [Sarracenia purpurea var. burkii]